MYAFLSLTLALTLAATISASADSREPVPDTLGAAMLLATGYRIEPNLPYETVAAPGAPGGLWEGKLDLYLPLHPPAGPLPAVVHFHGGGWVTGSKEQAALDVLPYIALGFAVVNVDYRLARVATAPAAVEDSRCALRWVARHAAQYGLDPARVVTAGSSAGAHLALMAALVSPAAGFDQRCPGDEPLRVAAVVNLFGVADVAELLEPAHARDFAFGWMGSAPDERDAARLRERAAAARRLSPLTYLEAGAAASAGRQPLPAVLTVHGDADPVVPFSQARRLHAALASAGARQRLHPVHGGGHGDFGGGEMLRLGRVLERFLREQGLTPPPAAATAAAATPQPATPGRAPGWPAPAAGSVSARDAGSPPPGRGARRPSAHTP